MAEVLSSKRPLNANIATSFHGKKLFGGEDPQAVIDSLLAPVKEKVTQVEDKVEQNLEAIDALASFKRDYFDIFTKQVIEKLDRLPTFPSEIKSIQGVLSSSSLEDPEEYVELIAGVDTTISPFNIRVTSLATAGVWKSLPVDSLTASLTSGNHINGAANIAAGNFTIGGQTIAIETDETLKTLHEKLANIAETAGIKPSIVAVSDTAYVLTIVNAETGTGTENDKLLNSTNAQLDNLFPNVADNRIPAANATLVYGCAADGSSGTIVTRSNNTITDLFPGDDVTIKLRKITPTATDVIKIIPTVTADKALVKQNLKAFTEVFSKMKIELAKKTIEVNSDGSEMAQAVLRDYKTHLDNLLGAIMTQMQNTVYKGRDSTTGGKVLLNPGEIFEFYNGGGEGIKDKDGKIIGRAEFGTLVQINDAALDKMLSTEDGISDLAQMFEKSVIYPPDYRFNYTMAVPTITEFQVDYKNANATPAYFIYKSDAMPAEFKPNDNSNLTDGGEVPVGNKVPLFNGKKVTFASFNLAATTNNVDITYDGGASFKGDFTPFDPLAVDMTQGGTITGRTGTTFADKKFEIRFVEDDEGEYSTMYVVEITSVEADVLCKRLRTDSTEDQAFVAADANDLTQGGTVSAAATTLSIFDSKAVVFSSINMTGKTIKVAYDGGTAFYAEFIPNDTKNNDVSKGGIVRVADAVTDDSGNSIPAALKGKDFEIVFVKNGGVYNKIDLYELDIDGTKVDDYIQTFTEGVIIAGQDDTEFEGYIVQHGGSASLSDLNFNGEIKLKQGIASKINAVIKSETSAGKGNLFGILEEEMVGKKVTLDAELKSVNERYEDHLQKISVRFQRLISVQAQFARMMKQLRNAFKVASR
jgi:hypothetical protein